MCILQKYSTIYMYHFAITQVNTENDCISQSKRFMTAIGTGYYSYKNSKNFPMSLEYGMIGYEKWAERMGNSSLYADLKYLHWQKELGKLTLTPFLP